AERLARIGVKYAWEYFLRDRKRIRLAVDDGRDVLEPGLMMLTQLRQPRMQATERQAVRRQHQRVRRQRFEPRQCLQIFPHRIGLWLRHRRDYRWRHVRQDLVARDQDPVALAKEQRVVRRMAASRDDAPLAPPHGDHLAVANAREF